MSLSRRGRLIAGAAAVVLILPPLALAAFPWGLVAERAAPRLSAASGRRMTIGSARRVDHFSLWPTVELTDVAIAQPAWAGRGALARIDHARIRFAALPLLIGRFRPLSVDVAGVRASLLRDGSGRENWHGEGGSSGGGGAAFDHVAIADLRVHLIDIPRHVTLDALAAVDARGVRIAGHGTHRGQPLRLDITGDPVVAGRPQSLDIAVASPLASLTGRVRLDRPLDLAGFAARIAGQGADLAYLDDFLQAGLFPTRPFRLTADVRHDGDRWRIGRLAGVVGRSRLAARIAVARDGGRTRVDADVDAATLDFDDLSSAAQRAKAAAVARATGPRVVPGTPLRLDQLGGLDATIRLDAARLLSAQASPFRTLKTTLTLDHRRLTAAPLRVGLSSGMLTGRAVIDHRAATPTLAIDLRLTGARIERLFLPRGELAGPLTARIRLTGAGDTARAAMARADGKVGIVVTGGDMRRDYAIFAGGDVLKSVGQLVGGEADRRAGVRCLVGDFVTRDGRMTPAPLVLDGELLRADGTGRMMLAGETIELSLAGRSRHPGLVQSTAPVRLFGTLSVPRIDVRPPRAERKGKGGVFERLGFLIKGLKTRGDAGRATPPAPVDCAGLRRAALD